MRVPELGERLDPATGEMVPEYGYRIDGTFIVDPFLSACGRFEVDPKKCYGLTQAELDALAVAQHRLLTERTG